MWMFYRRDHRGERGSRALEFSSRRGHLEIGNSSKRDFASTYRCVWKRLIEKKEKERNAPNFDAETRLDRICHSLRSILWFAPVSRSTPSSILAPINPQISWWKFDRSRPAWNIEDAEDTVFAMNQASSGSPSIRFGSSVSIWITFERVPRGYLMRILNEMIERRRSRRSSWPD